jgi:hypothetical protein
VAGGSYAATSTTGTDESSYFLSWDKVNIALGAEAASTPFHIILPDIFPLGASSINYQVAFGLYDSTTRLYSYYYHQSLYYTGTAAPTPSFVATLNSELSF